MKKELLRVLFARSVILRLMHAKYDRPCDICSQRTKETAFCTLSRLAYPEIIFIRLVEEIFQNFDKRQVQYLISN